jgi:histone H3/H4
MDEFSNMLPLKTLERMMRSAGARRVSQKALEELALVVEERISRVAEEAFRLTRHAGRKTVLASDVRLARRRLGC